MEVSAGHNFIESCAAQVAAVGTTGVTTGVTTGSTGVTTGVTMGSTGQTAGATV